MENLMLKSQIRSLQESLEFSRGERAALEAKLAALQGGTRNAEQRIVELTKQGRELRGLVAAATRLLMVTSREGALQAVQDIVANVIGSEEIALFEINAEASALTPLAWCGINEPESTSLAAPHGLVGQVAISGSAFTGPGSKSGITACIPLRVNGKVVAVLAIYSLLPQKLQLDPSDLDVLKLLENHAGKFLANHQPEDQPS